MWVLVEHVCYAHGCRARLAHCTGKEVSDTYLIAIIARSMRDREDERGTLFIHVIHRIEAEIGLVQTGSGGKDGVGFNTAVISANSMEVVAPESDRWRRFTRSERNPLGPDPSA
jgi:hypothetical protein